MLFKLVDIDTNSRLINFVFRNEDDDEIIVKTSSGDMFTPENTYNINITHNLNLSPSVIFNNILEKSYLGVVVRKTRKSVRIASGSTLWIVPQHMCNISPGIDVWIHVVSN